MIWSSLAFVLYIVASQRKIENLPDKEDAHGRLDDTVNIHRSCDGVENAHLKFAGVRVQMQVFR